MAWPGIFRRLFTNGGAGPMLRRDIVPPPFVVSATAPADISVLWIRPSDRTMYFYNGTQWSPIVGVYVETTGP